MFAKVILVGLFLTTLTMALPLTNNQISDLQSKLNLFKTNTPKIEPNDQNESAINENKDDDITEETDENDPDAEVIVGVSIRA